MSATTIAAHAAMRKIVVAAADGLLTPDEMRGELLEARLDCGCVKCWIDAGFTG